MVVLYTALPLSFCAALGAALPQFAAGDVDATTGITPTIIVPPSFQQEDVKNIQDAPNWALKNVTRVISSENRIWMRFHVSSNGYNEAICYFLAHVKGDAKIASFANEQCVGSNFTVSWGYSSENDAGVMTLINANATRNAWFGWNHVNKSEKLEDKGPNATTDTDS